MTSREMLGIYNSSVTDIVHTVRYIPIYEVLGSVFLGNTWCQHFDNNSFNFLTFIRNQDNKSDTNFLNPLVST